MKMLTLFSKKAPKVVVRSELYTKVANLLIDDFPNWTEGVCETYVHLPTRIGISTIASRAFIDIDCEHLNGRSGKSIDMSMEEGEKLYSILKLIIKAKKEKEQAIIKAKALDILDKYLGER